MSTPKSSSRRPFLFMILTPILSIVILFAILEAGIRIAGFNPMKQYITTRGREFFIRETPKAKYRYELNPGYAGKVGYLDFKINEAGFRGQEISPNGSGRRRIALVGDSITFSAEFRVGEIFAGLLEPLLSQIEPRAEVINMSVPGFDTLEEVEYFKDHGRKLKPEAVVLLYCLNDIGTTPMQTDTAEAFMQPRIPLRYASRFWLWIEMKIRRLTLEKALSRKLESGKAYTEAFAGLIQPVERDAFLEARFKEIDEAQAAFNKTKDNRRKAVAEKSGKLWLNEYKSLDNIGKLRYGFGELKKLADEDGFHPIIVIVPYFYTIDGAYLDAPAHAIVRREAERLGLEVVDTLPDFLPYGLEMLSNDNVHLNKKGHELMAGILKTILAPRLAAAPKGR